MLISQSSVQIYDNSGVFEVYLVLDSGQTAGVGDIVTCVVKRVRSITTKFSKGELTRVLLITSRFGSKSLDGTIVRSVSSNGGVIVSRNKEPLGTRISVPFSRQIFRQKGFTKLLSIAPFNIL